MALAIAGCQSSKKVVLPIRQLADCEPALEQTDPFNSAVMLGDTAIFVAEPGAQVLLRMRWPSKWMDTVGQVGEGPGEYQRPMAVFAQSGGRVAVLDAQLHRVLTIDTTGALRSGGLPRGIDPFSVVLDSLGHVYGLAPYFFPVSASQSSLRDSIPVLRWAGPESAPDTLGFVLAPQVVATQLKDGTSFREILYAEKDIWGVFPDGTLWIARGRDKRIDTRPPDGAWVRGLSISFPRYPTTSADRPTLPQRTPGGPRVSMAKIKAPFDLAVGTPEGGVWLRTLQKAGYSSEIYRAFTPSGSPAGSVGAAKGARIVAITTHAVLVGNRDADGLANLEICKRPVELPR